MQDNTKGKWGTGASGMIAQPQQEITALHTDMQWVFKFTNVDLADIQRRYSSLPRRRQCCPLHRVLLPAAGASNDRQGPTVLSVSMCQILPVQSG